MERDIFPKFLTVSREVLNENPVFKQKLEKVMGKVADNIVKVKYIEDDSDLTKRDDEKNDSSV